MVRESRLAGRLVHACEVCHLAYLDAGDASACEAHCRTHPSCSLEIGRRAVGAVAPPEDDMRSG
ncbi:MAG: hypothetical protein ACT4PT_07765 [Methanobacteriota archaeon]